MEGTKWSGRGPSSSPVSTDSSEWMSEGRTQGSEPDTGVQESAGLRGCSGKKTIPQEGCSSEAPSHTPLVVKSPKVQKDRETHSDRSQGGRETERVWCPGSPPGWKNDIRQTRGR